MIWIFVLLWLASVLLAGLVGWMLRGDVRVTAREDGSRYVKIDWEVK